MKFNEYIQLWKDKNQHLMNKCSMDKGQRESSNDDFKWTISVLERIGDAIQSEGMILTEGELYRLSILMRSLCSQIRERDVKAKSFVNNVMRME